MSKVITAIKTRMTKKNLTTLALTFGTVIAVALIVSFLTACNGFTYGAEDGITLSDITLIDPTTISSPAMRW